MNKAAPGAHPASAAWSCCSPAVFGPFSIDTIFPALRAIGEEFGADKLAMQQTISTCLLAYAVSNRRW